MEVLETPLVTFGGLGLEGRGSGLTLPGIRFR